VDVEDDYGNAYTEKVKEINYSCDRMNKTLNKYRQANAFCKPCTASKQLETNCDIIIRSVNERF